MNPNTPVLVEAQEKLKPTVTQLLADETIYNPFEDNQYLEQGTYLLARFDEAKKTIEDQRIAFTKPLNESLRAINKFFKTFSDPITQADQKLRAKLVEHRQKLEAGNGQALTTKKIGGVIVKKVWAFEVMDLSLLPLQYMVADEVKIRAAVLSGIRDIPGVRIYQDDRVSL